MPDETARVAGGVREKTGMNNEEWCKKNCPYSPDCACDGVCNFVLSLLKEQEPKTVLHRYDGDYCPRCSTITTRTMGAQKLHLGTRYCPYCGQAVKWDV